MHCIDVIARCRGLSLASKLFAVSMVATIAACSSVPQRLQLKAKDLATVQDAIDQTKNIQGITPLDQVNWLVQDSEKKCKDFTDSLFAETAGTNIVLDFISTIASGIGAAFSPLSTVHAASAVATVSNGTKTSISTEYLNALSISHVTQAIQSTYGADIQRYIQYLQSINDRNSIHLFDARTQILTYHAECSLASADSSIGSALQPPPAPAATATRQFVVTYTVTSGASYSKIADALLNIINNDINFKSVGISAADQNPSNPNGVLVLTVPSTATLAVSSSPADIQIDSTGQQTTLKVIASTAGTISITALITTQSQTSTSPNSRPSSFAIAYAVQPNQSAIDVASALLAAINNDPNLKASGISAAEQGGSTPNGTILLTLPGSITLLPPSVTPTADADKIKLNSGVPLSLQISSVLEAGTTITLTFSAGVPAKPPPPAIPGEAPAQKTG